MEGETHCNPPIRRRSGLTQSGFSSQPLTLLLQGLQQLPNQSLVGPLLLLATAAFHQFHLASRSPATHHQTPRDTNELSIFELHASTLIAVIEQHIDTSQLQLLIERFGQLNC